MSKIVLVTEAGSGIGLSIARVLSQQGHTVYASHSKHLDAVRVNGVVQMPLDLINDLEVRQCFEEIINRSGRLDVVVNCAHHELIGSAEGTSNHEVHDLFNANFVGTLSVCHAAIPFFHDCGGGYLINLASLNAQLPMPFQSLYASSQLAIATYTASLSAEVRQFNIKVVLLEIGEFQDDLGSSTILTSVGNPPHYGHQIQNLMDQVTKAKNKALKPEALGHLVGAIILNPNPRLRYGTHKLRHRIMVFLRLMLPGRILEKYIMWKYKIPASHKKKSDD